MVQCKKFNIAYQVRWMNLQYSQNTKVPLNRFSLCQTLNRYSGNFVWVLWLNILYFSLHYSDFLPCFLFKILLYHCFNFFFFDPTMNGMYLLTSAQIGARTISVNSVPPNKSVCLFNGAVEHFLFIKVAVLDLFIVVVFGVLAEYSLNAKTGLC